ncbi:MAG: response regulator, partial [Gammaproteobacteria bacterium]|nr:response regulator [Gammaproteobacteria bacterium]
GLKADEKRLRQVLINLLGNALKFTDQGSVTLRVSVMGHSAEKEAALRFEIIDTGVGLTPENLEKIFQPFEQVGDTHRQIEGTGLGLAITRQLVTLMGGELQVKSQAGHGSTFWFEATFPIVGAEARSSAAALEPRIRGYRGERRTILIVDDKEINCLVLRDFLEPLGFNTILATDGRAEVEQARQTKPDMILTDLIMPVMTGFEAVSQIRQIPEIKDTPIIAISASTFEMNVKESRLAGCDSSLPKPVDEQKLLGLLQELMNLEWEYEELVDEALTKAQTLDGDALIPPPVETLEALYELVTLGFISQIKIMLAQIANQDQRYNAFAQKMTQFANVGDEQKMIS